MILKVIAIYGKSSDGCVYSKQCKQQKERECLSQFEMTIIDCFNECRVETPWETRNKQTGTKCQPVIDPALSLAVTITIMMAQFNS